MLGLDYDHPKSLPRLDYILIVLKHKLRTGWQDQYPQASLVWMNSVRSLSEKAMAPHSSTLAWKIPWTEEPGRLQSMGSLRVGRDWETSLSLSLSLSLSCIGEGNGNPLQCSCLENPRERGACWAAIYGITQSQTRLTQQQQRQQQQKPLVSLDSVPQ